MGSKYKIHSIKYNAIMNVILKMSSFIFPLITFPYVSRVLKAASYGRVSFATSVVSYFTLVASLGIPAYGVRKCAEIRDDEKKLVKTVKELLAINTISLTLTYIAFVVFLILIPRFREDSTLLLISSLTIVLQTFGVEWFYQAIEQYDYITIRNIAFKIISIILMFIFVHSPNDYVIYCSINVFATVGSNILNITRLPKIVNLKIKTNLDLKQHLIPIFTLFFYYAATQIYTNLDTVMLGFMTNTSVVGFYNASVKIKNVLVSVVTALGSVALPRVSFYLSHERKEDFYRLISNSFSFVLFVAIPLSIYFTIEAKPVLLFLAGEEYAPAVSSMQAITPAVIFIGIGSVTAYQLLIPLKKDKITFLGAVSGAVIDFIINLILIPSYGSTGAAIGTLCAEILVVIIHLVALHDLLPKVFDKKDFLKIIISAAISTCVLITIVKQVQLLSYFVQCVITVLLFGTTYYLIAIVLKEKISIKVLKDLKARFYPKGKA